MAIDNLAVATISIEEMIRKAVEKKCKEIEGDGERPLLSFGFEAGTATASLYKPLLALPRSSYSADDVLADGVMTKQATKLSRQ
jgi:hypothetical protein